MSGGGFEPSGGIRPLQSGLRSLRSLLSKPIELTVAQARALANVHEGNNSLVDVYMLEEFIPKLNLTTDTVMSITGQPRESARRILGELVKEGLVNRIAPGRYEAVPRYEWPQTDREDGWWYKDGKCMTWGRVEEGF